MSAWKRSGIGLYDGKSTLDREAVRANRIATERLKHPESYAATLSDVLRAKPGTLTLAAENDLRQRLGLPAIGVLTCPSCGQVHVAGDCHGRPVAAVVVLSRGERVTQCRPTRAPDRIADYPVAQLRAALLRRYTYRGGI